MALTFVQASRWKITEGILSLGKAEFVCGECSKHTRKTRVIAGKYGKQVLVTAQCQWCGTYNAFYKNGRPMILT